MAVVYLTLEQILLIHEDQIVRYGGLTGLRNLPLIESAAFRLQVTFDGKDMYPSLFDKAAVLMQSLILNHAFIDGNKRTGTAAMLIFLELNGYRLQVTQSELVDATMNVALKEWSIERLAEWISKYIKKI